VMSETRTTGASTSSAGFIGRATELAQLEAALGDAREGNPQLVFVSGESGVGKSRLLSELRDRLPELGAGAFGGECIDLGEDELPYAPLVGAIRPLVRASDPVLGQLGGSARAEFARLVPELGESGADRGEREVPAEAQRRLFDALLALLDRKSGEQPVVFWLEDVHWADRSTRSFLSFLARSLRSEKVLCVLTLRSDELHRRHPMRPLLAELARLPNARVIELSRFSESELRDQLRSILGAEPESELVDRMFKRSEGNPLFTEQLLAGGLDGRGGLPPTLRDALLLRLERLDETTQRVLRMLAIVGSTGEETLATAAGLELEALRAAVREAVAANLLDAEESGRFRFRHALLREVVHDDLLPGERAEGHLAVAKALQAGAEGTPSAMLSAAIAHHYNSAGVQDEAIRSATVAAKAAIHVHADAEAASLLERVLALWPRVEDPEALTGMDYPAMLYWAGRVSFCAGDDLRAVALYEKAAEGMRDDEDPRRRAEVLGKLASCQWTQGMADRATETLEEALELAPKEAHDLRSVLLGYRVRLALLQGKFAHTVQFSDEALAELELAGPDGPRQIKVTVLNRLGTALVALGEIARGEQALREAVEVGEGCPDWDEELGTAYGNYSDAMFMIGRSGQSEEIARRGIEAMPQGSRAIRWLRLQLSDILFHMGRWSDAEALLPPGPGVMSGSFRVCFDLYAAQLLLGRDNGDLGQARELLEDAHQILRESIEPQLIASLASLQTELELLESDVPAARRVVENALDRLEFCTEDELRFLITSTAGLAVEAEAARLARDVGSEAEEAEVRDRAERMLARVEATLRADDDEVEENPVSRALATEAAASFARAVEADDVAERWARAAKAWGMVERPMAEARAHQLRAEALVEQGDREGAACALADARRIAAPTGPSRFLTSLDSFAARARLTSPAEPSQAAEPASERPFGLTERELQVVALLAEGMTNREIGERLFMAEKTASVHVSRILSKLDVRSRTEAAAVAHRQGLTASVADAG
jgi:DNA-binding CsgD family transcriptional regulator/tetratricopeptide (TPR) repeat protein